MKNLVMVTTAALSLALCAQEEAATDSTEAAEVPVAKAAVGGKTVLKPFMALPQCTYVDSPAEVRLPGGEWTQAEQGRHYPLGTSYRTSGKGKLTLTLGFESSATISGDSSFGTRVAPIGSQTRTISLESGRLELDLADNLPEGAMQVAAPGFVANNLIGESRFDYADKGDGDEAVVRCVTGSLSVEGRHFKILSMRAANEFKIRTSRDHLLTFIYGNSGDIAMKLDQGVKSQDIVGDDGSVSKKSEKADLDWRLSPKTKVVIARALPSIGERMSVHTMCFDAAGERKSECAFCEGRAEVNSGELVAAPKTDSAELAKRAAEATETTEAADAEETTEEKSDSSESSSEESAAE